MTQRSYLTNKRIWYWIQACNLQLLSVVARISSLHLGVERTEKACVGSGIDYLTWNQDWIRVSEFTQCG